MAKLAFVERWNLLLAYYTESQAIAIYEAECMVLGLSPFSVKRKISLHTCTEILREEKEHQTELLRWLKPGFFARLYCAPNLAIGYAIGIILALLPSSLFWKMHAIAERQAAETYEKTLKSLRSPEKDLARFLRTAVHQEMQHRERFIHLERAQA